MPKVPLPTEQKKQETLGRQPFQTEEMNRAYQAHWQRVFNQKMGSTEPFDVEEIEARHQGGFYERYIARSTSKQYQEFIEAFKEYHDPESSNYLNKENLTTKGDAYLQHKIDQGYTNLDDLKGTSLIRAKLVTATIEACKETTKEAVEQEWLEREAEPSVEREQFLTAEDVAEDDFGAYEPEEEADLGTALENDDIESSI